MDTNEQEKEYTLFGSVVSEYSFHSVMDILEQRNDLHRLVRLLDEQRAASGWGAAVGQREEEIAGLRRNLGV